MQAISFATEIVSPLHLRTAMYIFVFSHGMQFTVQFTFLNGYPPCKIKASYRSQFTWRKNNVSCTQIPLFSSVQGLPQFLASSKYEII